MEREEKGEGRPEIRHKSSRGTLHVRIVRCPFQTWLHSKSDRSFTIKSSDAEKILLCTFSLCFCWSHQPQRRLNNELQIARFCVFRVCVKCVDYFVTHTYKSVRAAATTLSDTIRHQYQTAHTILNVDKLENLLWFRTMRTSRCELSAPLHGSCGATLCMAVWGNLINIAWPGLGLRITNVSEGGSCPAPNRLCTLWRKIVSLTAGGNTCCWEGADRDTLPALSRSCPTDMHQTDETSLWQSQNNARRKTERLCPDLLKFSRQKYHTISVSSLTWSQKLQGKGENWF